MPSGEPWIVLRVVVEVKVPPKTPATEKDLVWAVQQALPATFTLPRPTNLRARVGAVRVKGYERFWPALARKLGWRKPLVSRTGKN